MNLTLTHEAISTQILNAFENQKSINKKRSNLIHVSEDTIRLKINGNINISIKKMKTLENTSFSEQKKNIKLQKINCFLK